MYSVMADEARDGHTEQLAVFLWYIVPEGIVKERFLALNKLMTLSKGSEQLRWQRRSMRVQKPFAKHMTSRRSPPLVREGNRRGWRTMWWSHHVVAQVAQLGAQA